jgi:hypothetical protein
MLLPILTKMESPFDVVVVPLLPDLLQEMLIPDRRAAAAMNRSVLCRINDFCFI